MSNNKCLNFLIAFFLSAPIFSAQANEFLISEINELSRAIRHATIDTQASDQELALARDSMQEALELVESSGSGHNNKECFDYAYAKYYQSNSSESATNKAVAACRIIADLSVLKYAFEKYYSSNSSESAIDKAAKAATRDQKGKLDMIEYAYNIYYSSASSDSALTAAATGVANVPRGSLQCVKDLYNKYYQSNSSQIAMNKALEGCSR